MIVSDIATRLKRTFGDESGVQVTDADILRWVNDGQRYLVKNNEGLLEKTALASTTINVQEYDLPVDLLILKTIMFKGTGDTFFRKIRGYSLAEFNEYVDGWAAGVDRGVPVSYMIHASKIVLWPIPNESVSNSLKVYYNRIPTDVTAVGDTPDIPTLYHEGLLMYCLKQAYELDENMEASIAKGAELTTDLATLRGREDWREQEVYPTITILAEDL